MTFEDVGELQVDPSRARVYAEGWQSWTPTSPLPARHPGHRPVQPWESAMRFRPGHDLPDEGVQGEGLLVIDPGTGGEVTRWSMTGDAEEAVPSIRAVLDGDRVHVSADGAVASATAPDLAGALIDFADDFAATARVGERRTMPRTWCSWYQYFEDVTEADIRENLRALDEHDLDVEVVQIDDGYSRGLGEWLEPSAGFPSLERVAEEIIATGRTPGIWLAPFLVGEKTTLARERPEWVTGYAGHNWGQDMRGLDLTHPGVREYLHEVVTRLRTMGFGYFKLDFLYGGCVPATRYDDISGVAAYRSGLRLLREAAGEQAVLLGCGAPILPSVGLLDAMRVSPDTFHEGGEDGSRGLRGRMSLAARAWQHGRFWTNDPDCIVARSSYALREDLCATVEAFGGMHSASDRIADLDEWGLRTTRRLLAEVPSSEPFGDEVVRRGLEVAAQDGLSR